MKNFLFITAAFFYLQICTAQTDSIGYFGQTPPGDTAVIFAPGIISLTNRLEDHIVFSPDGNECYFSVWGASYSSAKIYYTKRENNIWSSQVEAPFSVGHYAKTPFFSTDGNKLYFDYGGAEPKYIWMVQRTTQGWNDPQVLPSPINSGYSDGCYSETADSIAYFTSTRPGGQGYDIWCTYRMSGQPLQAKNLGTPVNSAVSDYASYIAHDGSYLIFTSERPGGHAYSDLYITFRKESGDWTVPVNMERNGAGINIINTAEVSPTLSPDGRFLFFTRYTNTGGVETEDIYWVNAEIIDKLKHSNFPPYLKTQIPDQRDTVGHPFNYQIPDTTFVDDNGNNTLSYSAKQSNGLALPSWLTFDNTTRTFSGTPTATGILTIKITATDTANASASCTFKMRVYPSTTAVEKDKSQLPKESQLFQNYPNPFNPSTTIRYSLVKSSFVRLTIYNVVGQKIRTLQNAFQTAGEHSLVWDAMDDKNTPASSGMYFYSLAADNLSMQKKMLIVK
jgi:Putative Ig domain/FlgD Ig-like domain/WD40-like Beta Propeller Repeat